MRATVNANDARHSCRADLRLPADKQFRSSRLPSVTAAHQRPKHCPRSAEVRQIAVGRHLWLDSAPGAGDRDPHSGPAKFIYSEQGDDFAVQGVELRMASATPVNDAQHCFHQCASRPEFFR